MAARTGNGKHAIGPELLIPLDSRRRSGLILPRFLSEEADKYYHRGEQRDRAHEIVKRWADLETQGHLAKAKETELDANFIHEVFGDALGYRRATHSPEQFEQKRNYVISGVGEADGALGNFRPGATISPLVVIELKGPRANLDKDKFNGRTAVQQCWDYLNGLPDCPWGIVSNFVTLRLYHRDKTPLAYEEFKLRELRDEKRFREFWCLFERGALVRPRAGQSLRALELLRKTEDRQREVGDELYIAYSEHRYMLIEHLYRQRGKSLERAIHIAQKILDRIIFIAFCEDRGLLPAKCIDQAYRTLPPFSKVTNPRWQNFLDLFQAVDRGHEQMLGLTTGYNGGLFRHDEEVDDLQLDDDWTNFFRTISTYDFRDEVNVEVLGHIFEKSIAELEKIRLGGLFADEPKPVTPPQRAPAMRKSAQRKRFGIYYTPPDFTRFIVENTVGTVILAKFADLLHDHDVDQQAVQSDERADKVRAYWNDCLDALRSLRICDPACGSGAFLIEAYDKLEEAYAAVVERLSIHDPEQGERLESAIPDYILADNLYGVDVSPQAVEITQLALWIRSARQGKTLADLSQNILWANSLVSDPQVHPRAMQWREQFADVFGRQGRAGFDCVIGNPPWERMKLQEREFFAFSAPEIAGAVNAATRRKKIAALKDDDPKLFDRYEQAKRSAETTLAYVRACGDFPLTARGDINTYMLFAELARNIVAPHGRVGLLVPSGIATDKTTSGFFRDIVETRSLVSLHDYENKAPVFPDVHRSFKFSTLLLGGPKTECASADFVFFARRMEDLADKNRHISLSRRDMSLLNPNTHTCPIFRTRRDAELTKAIYRRVPILVDRTRADGGNPWGIKFFTMFHQTNDAELFHTADALNKKKFKLVGNRWAKGKQAFLPLYEAKMVQAYDHRAAGVIVKDANWIRQGQTEPTTLVFHQNPEFTVQPRWWVDENEVVTAFGGEIAPAYLCYKDVTSPTNQRTMIAAMIPLVGVANSAPLVLTDETISPRQQCCLLANLNSLPLDYVARQKVGGVHLNFFIVEQLPMFPPDRYAEKCPWHSRQTLRKWISDRVLKLTCTANDMIPLADAADFSPQVHKWNPRERKKLRAELDAAFFLLYGIERADVEYILSTFSPQRSVQETESFLDSQSPVLEAFDRLQSRA